MVSGAKAEEGAVAVAKKRVVELAVQKGGHLSFAEINRLEPASKGDFWLSFKGYANIVMWNALSEAYAEAISQFLSEETLHPHPASQLPYRIDGSYPGLPVAKSLRQYKKPHSFPMMLHMEPRGS